VRKREKGDRFQRPTGHATDRDGVVRFNCQDEDAEVVVWPEFPGF
jgi:hypothetical protein